MNNEHLGKMRHIIEHDRRMVNIPKIAIKL